jgi:hypothetical protein
MDTGGWTPRRRAGAAGAAVLAGLLAAATTQAGWIGAALLASAVAAGGLALALRTPRSADDARQRARELRSRAEQQDRWTAHGDLRGIYGTEGAELVRTVSLFAPDDGVAPDDDVQPAGVVHTDAELQGMLREKPPCWQYAAFASILVQRRAAVQTRLHDARMGFGVRSGEVTRTDVETAMYFLNRFDDFASFTGDVTDFMLSPGFRGALGPDGQSDDPAEIVHAAHRFMDFHDRAIGIAERWRAVTVPASARDLQREFSALPLSALEGFQTFIGELVDRVAEMAEVARYATGSVLLDPVVLAFGDIDELLSGISTRLAQIRRGA